MIKISKENFVCKDIFECGQVFRYKKLGENVWQICAEDKIAILTEKSDCIEIDACDIGYFVYYFDMNRNYSAICETLTKDELLIDAAEFGKGIRLLNQDPFETLISFIISQNNHIPRIKSIIEKLCTELGEKREFGGIEYFTFPTAQAMATKDENFYEKIGAGYRVKYLAKAVQRIANGYDLNKLNQLCDGDLKKELLSFLGVGNKVCDCVMLFAFKRTHSFPVDTWLQKVYNEQYGEKKSREQIAEFYSQKWGELAGFAQQYLFYYKREQGR